MRRYLMAAAAALTVVGATAVTTQAADSQPRPRPVRLLREQLPRTELRSPLQRSPPLQPRLLQPRLLWSWLLPAWRQRQHRLRVSGYGYGYGYPSYGYGYPSYGYGYPSYGYSYPSYGYGYPSYGYSGPTYGCGYRTVWRVTPRGRVKVRTRVLLGRRLIGNDQPLLPRRRGFFFGPLCAGRTSRPSVRPSPRCCRRGSATPRPGAGNARARRYAGARRAPRAPRRRLR